MYKEIIFLFFGDSFPGKQVPDIIEYDLHNPVLEWISNLPKGYEKNNRKSLKNCYHPDIDWRYVKRMKNNLACMYIKEKTAMVGSGHSKIGF